MINKLDPSESGNITLSILSNIMITSLLVDDEYWLNGLF